MDLSVVVPVRNEAENILPLISEIHGALSGRLDFEIVYVNDGSDDATAEQLKKARAQYPMLRVITHDRACGQSRAVVSGIRHAKAKFIATLDGDGQNDPASIPAMWERLHQGGAADTDLVICGFRKDRKDTGVRRLASRIANGIRARLLGDATPDSGCGLKLFARETFLELPHFDHMHRFLPALFLKRGCKVVSVEVHHRPRERGTSKYGILDRLWAGIWDLLGVMWLQRRTRYPIIKKEE